MSDAATIIERIAAEGIRTVDFRFTDLAGRWRHLGRDAGGVDAELLGEGMFIDGSSIPGWRDVTEADLLLKPDLASSFRRSVQLPSRPWFWSATRPSPARASATIAIRALRRSVPRPFCAAARYADEVRIAAEITFCIFDEAKVELGPMRALYQLASSEHRGTGGAARGSSAGPRSCLPGAAAVRPDGRPSGGDRLASWLALGMPGLEQAHGRAAGQNQIRFGASGLVEAGRPRADAEIRDPPGWRVLRQGRHLHGQAGDRRAGSGMSMHQALWRDGRPTFAGQGYADLSQHPCSSSPA